MGSPNGHQNGHAPYVSLADLDAIPWLEEDVLIEGLPKPFRVRALDHATIGIVANAVRAASGDGAYNQFLEQEYYVAYGLVAPDVGAHEDIDTALSAVRKIGRSPVIFGQLYRAILGLTYRDPKESYADFFAMAGSDEREAPTPHSSSTTP